MALAHRKYRTLTEYEFYKLQARNQIDKDTMYFIGDEPYVQPQTTHRVLSSYICNHCGGSIDSTTMHCEYCGVGYFFSNAGNVASSAQFPLPKSVMY